VSYKSTPASIAAVTVDEALRSAVGANLLHAVDSAIGEVFYSVVYEAVYIRSWCAVFATWRASVPPVADREVGIKPPLSVPPAKPREEAPKKRVQAEMRKCDGWMRSTTTIIIALAVAVLAGFARSHSSRARTTPPILQRRSRLKSGAQFRWNRRLGEQSRCRCQNGR
jgi:hypothetical protein